MALPNIEYKPGGFVSDAFQRSQDIANQLMSNYFYPKITQAELENKNALTKSTQINNQFLPQGLQLANENQALVNKNYTPNILSEIGLRGSQTRHFNKETELMPLKAAIEAQNSIRSQSRFGGSYQLHQALGSMTQDARMQWISQNPEAYNSMLTDLANSNQGPDILSPLLGKYFKSAPAPVQNQIVQATKSAINNQLLNSPQVNPSEYNNQISQGERVPFTNSPKKQEEFAVNSQYSANRKAATAAINNRADSAIAMESFLDRNRKRLNETIDDMTQYNGYFGATKKKLDELKKISPKAYENFRWFENVFKPHVSNQVKMSEKLASSDTQREELHGLIAGINDLHLDPSSGKRLLSDSINTLHDISDSIIDAAEPYNKGVYKKKFNLPEKYPDYISENYKNENNEIKQNNSSGNESNWNLKNGKLVRS
jgi:hypothetical protein